MVFDGKLFLNRSRVLRKIIINSSLHLTKICSDVFFLHITYSLKLTVFLELRSPINSPASAISFLYYWTYCCSSKTHGPNGALFCFNSHLLGYGAFTPAILRVSHLRKSILLPTSAHKAIIKHILAESVRFSFRRF